MVRERGPSRTSRTFSSVFNSSVAQRPTQKSAARAFGGRPLGPNTYVPPPPTWHNDPSREMSIFSSKTALRTYDTPITSQLDFTGLSAPLTSQLAVQRVEAPGSRGLHWPDPPEPREVQRDPGLDTFSDAFTRSMNGDVMNSSRKYAASFQSTEKRGQDYTVARPTSPALGPGVYELPLESVRVRDPKRMNYTFKSQTDSSIFGVPAGQPPDTVQSIQSAILGRHWTSKGVAFSTRERFPRARPKWKE